MKNSKAKDVHGLDTNFLKRYKTSLIRPITHLINLSLTQSAVPLPWKMATVTPVFKSGDKTNPENYRPISILPVISKIAEKWVAELLMEHLNKGHASLHPMQFGFRAHHSTETAVCVFIERVKCLLDRFACVGAVFLDLKRAFDTVNHRVLLSKLSAFNFSEQAILWIESYLSCRKQCVQVDGVKSPYLDCSIGVPQGSVLGPILFSLYINELPNVCKNVDTLMYADDAVIFIHGKNSQDVTQTLTTAMTLIYDWLTNSCLSLNTKKTVHMMFTKPSARLAHSKVHLRGEELMTVDKFKYLGVVIDSTLSFKSHVKKVTNIVKFNLHNFRQIRTSLTEGAALIFLHSMIFSHIDYCLTSWSHTGATILKPIESLFKKALKVLDKKPFSYHHCNILHKYNLLSFDNFKTFKTACLMYKALHGLAPPPLEEYIKQRTTSTSTSRVTRATARGDCEVPRRRTTFGQNVLSVRGSVLWNSLPLSVRECSSFLIFKNHLKMWLRTNQTCDHL